MLLTLECPGILVNLYKNAVCHKFYFKPFNLKLYSVWFIFNLYYEEFSDFNRHLTLQSSLLLLGALILLFNAQFMRPVIGMSEI